MPQTTNTTALGQRLFMPANYETFPSYPATIAIYCRAHVPQHRALPRQHWESISQEEAHEKHLICCSCRMMLATGEQAPLLPDVFAQVLGGVPDTALWARSQSWIIAEGLQRWIHQVTVPEGLCVYTRPLLLEHKEDAGHIPASVTLEVEVRCGEDLEHVFVRHLDVAGCVPDLLDLMYSYGCEVWRPLRRNPSQLGTHEMRTVMAGISTDSAASDRIAQALANSYGAFTVEWLCTAQALFPQRI